MSEIWIGKRTNRFTRQQVDSFLLSPENAESNPDLFKYKMLYLLGRERNGKIYGAGTKKAWLRLCRDTDMGLEKISLIVNSWVSQASIEGIKLGVAPIDIESKERLLFVSTDFSAEDDLLYRLSHEITHLFTAKFGVNHTGVDQIARTMIKRRSHVDNSGFTSFGSLTHVNQQARSPEQQAGEDLVELVNMCLWNQDYFKLYMDYLTLSAYSSERINKRIVTLKKDVSEHIYTMITNFVDSELSK